jgi:hypothetical protein
MLAAVLLMYALIVKQKTTIGVQIINGAAPSVSIATNEWRLGVRLRNEADAKVLLALVRIINF